MKEKKILFSRLLFVICFSIAFYLCLSRINVIWNFTSDMFKVFGPVVVGLITAFVLNIPMSFIEKLLYKAFPSKTKTGKNKIIEVKPSNKKRKLIRTLSIVITIVLIFLFIRGLIIFIIPQLVDTVESIVSNVPVYFEQLKSFAYELRDKFDIPNETIDHIVTSSYNWLEDLTKDISTFIPTVIKTTQNITSGIFNFIMSVIIAIYMLTSKERLCRMLKKITYAMFNKKDAERIVEISNVANKTFNAFAKGQILEAFIIGVLCYVGMIAFRLEYSLLISVIIGVSALIPIFGAFIGGAIGTILLFTISPIKGLWFIIFIIILQQLEGNFIYPKVVGTSIGISGLWVLIALIVGGALAGIPGILIGIPLFATVYELFQVYINNKLKEKDVIIE